MERISVESTVLQWARKSAGFHDVPLAAKRLSVSENTLNSWETGTLQPTIKQLRTISRIYKRPLAVLLLPTPPKDFDALRDFRRSAGGDTLRWSPALESEFRRAVSQREVYLELQEVAPRTVIESKLVFGFRLQDGAEAAAEKIRTALDMDSWQPSLWSKPRELLNQAVTVIEDLGVQVIHTRDVDISEMRGFSIAEWPFPVIAVNGSDWPRPRLFTLLHELAHLGLRDGGLCDLHESPKQTHNASDEVERFCNRVAAAILMPEAQLMANPTVRASSANYRWSLEELEALSHQFGASSEAVLIRLIDLNKANWNLYTERRHELEQIYTEHRRQEKEKRKGRDGGPSYYLVKARDLGHAYVSSVLDAYNNRAISSLDVADYLNVRFEQLPKLQEALRR
ncbi:MULTISPECIES: XRE family transcriptional regulator [Nocardia]|uniref:XRE family transcriptional regulator n=1 Tax=Nocardia TaxID=1817 RepID=UPI0024560E5B|nr:MULTISPECIES: XRE family transcriptional regulator [Nocardia]